MQKGIVSVLFLLLAGVLYAQTPSELLADFDQMEERIFQLKIRGQYEEAQDGLTDGLVNLIRVQTTAAPDFRAELAARGECYLELLYLLASSTARYDQLAEVLNQVPEEAPAFHALAQFLKLRLALHTGDLEKARAQKSALGFINDWYLVGPFDNERGSGFDQAFEPETGLDLSARYDGKEREISWRRIMGGAPNGFINLNAQFNPNDQCLAYALTFVRSETDKDVALRLGSDEALKVFFNGHPVLATDARRLHHFDQNAVGFHLQAGLNVLMLKICDQTESWGFSARLTSPAGAPLEGVEIVEAPPGFTLTPNETPPSEVPADRGALGHYEKCAADGVARANLYLGLLHYLREYEGEDARRAATYLEAFLEGNPDHLFGRYLRALTASRRLEMLSQGERNEWRIGLEETLVLDPKNVESRVKLGQYYLSFLVIPERAEAYALAALEANPDFLPAAYLLAELYSHKGMEVRSRKTISGLFGAADEGNHPQLRVRLGNLARAERRLDKAAAHYEAALRSDYLNTEARDSLIDLALKAGNLDRARELLKNRLALNPFSHSTLKSLARMARGEGEGAEALALLDRVLQINPEDDEALKMIGDIEHFHGRDEKALAAYKQALEINPKAKNLRRYVEFLFEEEKAFEEDFKVDPLALVASHPSGENTGNNSHEYLLLQKVIKVNLDGTSSEYQHRLTRILNHEGAKRFDVFFTAYTPGEQRCRITIARVIHPDGSIDEARISNRESPSSMGTGERVPAMVDLPPLKAGDVVEVAFRKDDLVQSFFGDYFGYRHFFQQNDLEAVKDARLTLILPKARAFRFNQRNLDLQPEISEYAEEGLEVHSWTLSDLPKVNPERSMPGANELTPCVEVTTYESWDELGLWWWNLVQKQCDCSGAMRTKVAELTEGLETERSKARAIYHYVISEIRYSDAWEFGVHGFKPYLASAIFTRCFGDCKDKSILLKSLLKEAGIEAYPVLIRADISRSREDLTLPMIDHFNHAITYIPTLDNGPGVFIDGTATYHGFEALPLMDVGATVFVVKDGPGEIMTIPYPQTGSNLRRLEFEVEVAVDGSAGITVHNESRGAVEAGIRQEFLNPGMRHSRLEEVYGSIFGQVALVESTFTDVDDLIVPFQYDAKLRVNDFLLKSGDDSQLRPVFFPSRVGRIASEDERTRDLLLGAPSTLSSVITYRLAKGLTVPTLPPNTTLDREFGFYQLTFEKGADNKIVVKRELALREPRIAAADYPAFREFCREAERAEQLLIQVVKAGEPASLEETETDRNGETNP